MSRTSTYLEPSVRLTRSLPLPVLTLVTTDMRVLLQASALGDIRLMHRGLRRVNWLC